MSASGPLPEPLTIEGDETIVERPLASGRPVVPRDDDDDDDDDDAEAPRFLGRYVVIDELGQGGMGRVFRAYDPQLDREVALKLLRRVTDDARTRLLREAQAMAQLSHPNVLPVYDVATEGHRLFIAMELVRGQSLRAWLDQGPHPWSKVLAVFLAAGQGLHAAHAAGLVHRDFKPGNVLIGDDGRIRVMDFGLARGMVASPPRGRDSSRGGTWTTRTSSDSSLRVALSALRSSREPSDELSWSSRGSDDGSRGLPGPGGDSLDVLSSLTAELTQLGTVIGTPSYMAPEQHLGSSADVRSDQYGFCVALWEALYGERPFQAKRLDDWYRAKTSRRPRADPQRGVPRWLHAVVARGLAPRPGQRYPGMPALLRALSRGQRRRRQRLGAVGGVLLLLLCGAGAGLHAMETTPLCTGAQEKLVGTWGEPEAQRLERAFLASEVSFAADTWMRVAPRLHDYAARWQAAHSEACQATHVRHEQPEAVMDARMRCLEERRLSLHALVQTLATADADVIERAVSATTELPRIESCADPLYVEGQAPPPDDPAHAAEVRALEEQLAHTTALSTAGKSLEALPLAHRTLEQARAVGHPPTEIAAMLRVGQLEEDAGHYERAQSALEQAYFAAQDAGLDRPRALAAIQLIHVMGRRRGLPDRARAWERFARAALQRVPDPAVEASYLNNAGLLYGMLDDYEAAIGSLRHALEIRERLDGPRHPRVARVLNNLALMHDALGHFDQAQALHQRALEIREHTLGPHHPEVATSLLNLSNIEKVQAHYDRALELLTRAHAIWEHAYGPDHPHTAGTLVNLGSIHEQLGDGERALERYRSALVTLRRTQGEHHPNVAGTLANMGNVYRAQGDTTRALALYQQALESFEHTLGPNDVMVSIALLNMGSMALDAGDLDTAEAHTRRAGAVTEAALGAHHPKMATVHGTLALIHAARGEHDQALVLYERAVELRREALGPRHPDTGLALAALGRGRLDRHEPDAAIEPLREAVDILALHDDQRGAWHLARFDLARARWEAGIHPSAARAEALAARRALAQLGPAQREHVETIERWLREHRRPSSGR